MEGTYIGQKIRYGQSLVFAEKIWGLPTPITQSLEGKVKRTPGSLILVRGMLVLAGCYSSSVGVPKRTLHGS
jgi:hypothetical protein